MFSCIGAFPFTGVANQRRKWDENSSRGRAGSWRRRERRGKNPEMPRYRVHAERNCWQFYNRKTICVNLREGGKGKNKRGCQQGWSRRGEAVPEVPCPWYRPCPPEPTAGSGGPSSSTTPPHPASRRALQGERPPSAPGRPNATAKVLTAAARASGSAGDRRPRYSRGARQVFFFPGSIEGKIKLICYIKRLQMTEVTA